MGAFLKIGVNEEIGVLLTSWHGLLGGKKMTKAVEQISRIEMDRASGRGKHLTGEAKRGSVNYFSGGAANVGFQCGANAEENEREVIGPVSIALSSH